MKLDIDEQVRRNLITLYKEFRDNALERNDYQAAVKGMAIVLGSLLENLLDIKNEELN